MHWIKTTYNKLLKTSKAPKKQRDFGILLLIVTILFFAIETYKNGLTKLSLQLSLVAFFILILTFAFRKIFQPLLFVWLLIGEVLGVITSTIIMGIVYFLLFSPIAFFQNLKQKKESYKPGWKTVDDTVYDYTKLN